MEGDTSLVGCLVDRIAARLPHRTGSNCRELERDDIVVGTRSTLIAISVSSISSVLESLAALLEDLERSHKSHASHPTHVVLSEAYVLALVASCCTTHWDAVKAQGSTEPTASSSDTRTKSSRPGPGPLAEDLVSRYLNIIACLLDPIPDSLVLSPNAIPNQVTTWSDQFSSLIADESTNLPVATTADTQDDPEVHAATLEVHAKTIVEYLTASSWDNSFEHFKNVIYDIRTAGSSHHGTGQAMVSSEEDRHALVALRLLAFFWVDAQKLGFILKELCSSYLHFRRPYQITIAAVVPVLITNWINRYPHQFVRQHTQHKRLDGGADTLFDMTHAMGDQGRRKGMTFALQITLLLLLPDVFEVASNLRDATGNRMAKKTSFLDTLRKALRNRNEAAAYSFVTLLRAARHFDAEDDAALVSFALDIQDEVKDAVFRRSPLNAETALFGQDLLTATFVSQAQLNLDGCVDTLVESCLGPTAPQSFKATAVQGCGYLARQRDSEKYERLFTAVLPYVLDQLKLAAGKALEASALEIGARDSDPDGTKLICLILDFLDASPKSLLAERYASDGNASNGNPGSEAFEAFLSLNLSPNPVIRTHASTVSSRLFKEPQVVEELKSRGLLKSRTIRARFWSRSCRVLTVICDRVMSGGGSDAVRDVYEFLSARVALFSCLPELAEVPDIPELVTVASKYESTLLVALCSPDIETCQMVTSLIARSIEASPPEARRAEAAKVLDPLYRNMEIFDELGSTTFRFTGLVAFQKRMRGLLRRLLHPTAGILAAWAHAFDRWLHLSREVSSAPLNDVDERTFAEWRNISGFLASLGGICVENRAAMLEDPALGGLKWIDKPSDSHEEAPLSRYLRLSIQLLGCANIRVRESTREVLSSDISAALYQPLFKALEAELDVLFDGVLAPNDQTHDAEIVFAEQAISLLRALVERLDSPSHLGAASSVHLGAVTLSFVKFMDGMPDTVNTLRVKIKICQLCEVVNKRKEYLNPRDDVRIRNHLLEYILGWIVRPWSPHTDGHALAPNRHDEIQRVQKDLDKACLKSLAELTFRLPLQPGEGQTDASTSELKSKMFHLYFSRFLSLLNHEPAEAGRNDHGPGISSRDEAKSSSELAITILSNILSANIDVGLKHSLNIGYHKSIEMRTAFLRVLCNILVQGTEFSNLTDSAVSEKYDELLELLTKDMTLVAAVSVVCPSTEVDELSVSLLTIFEHRGKTFDLFETLIKQEIEDTENETEILRRTCVATKMLSIYAKWKGQAYLKATLQQVVERLMLTSKDLALELDPARVASPDELQKNALQLQIVVKVFIDEICASSANIPPAFRKICNIISTAVRPRFPEAKYTAVGAFIFLRFFCPAIVAPEVEGLLDTSPSKELRRGLLLIAKVIQNLANNVLFGAKEPYMFPLNDFLSHHIFRVTTFLREISVLPESSDYGSSMECFDFGSCIALHRFLYDHWDHVRQKLVTQERRDYVRSPAESSRGRTPVLEPLRNLITNLGPPPLAVTWNRPQVSANTPSLYSRFQDFMLRNAFRGTESLLAARPVYDGGESKDSLPIICIILRHIDSESIDYDTLLFCFLKIASRLWHRPFGLLIDATCYQGQNEPQDDVLRRLERLTPVELSRNLTRIYVYNMNSAFRKCFRRILRVSVKSESNIFHPKNVEYHLIGSLQDLQTHFHLSQLHLPKETISVVTDTRYVFQPVTRLSKSRGKIEVVIKVGSQFVQITTTNKQDVFPGYRLSTTVNDIFRLGEVDEAPTSIQTEDDSAFGLRADNGRIVMYFTSPKMVDVLQSLRAAKAKYGKDNRVPKPFERLIRPQDVPGTLLNLSLSNLSSSDHVLRLASYNLLGALCKAFRFSAASKLMCMIDIAVPVNPARFIVSVSQQLARSEPQLTYDFLTEFFVGWESFSDEQKPLSLAYMAPWLPGLRTAVLASDSDGDKAKEKIASLFRKLIDIAVTDQFLAYTLEQVVWPVVFRDETLLEIFLDELMKTALDFNMTEAALDGLSSIISSINTITLRAKIISRLRKALNRTSLRPTKYLPDNVVWPEIRILLRFCVSLSFDNGVQSQLYLPEIFHVVTILGNTGSSDVRLLVHHLLVNTIHAACTSFALDESKLNKLRSTLDLLSEPRSDIFLAPAASLRDGASISTTQDSGPVLAATETLASSLFEVCTLCAPSVDISNAWRSRWMSLVASTAFQNNPAVQPRAFAVMGCLAREEVDDDLLYQVLVALRNSVGRLGDETNIDMFISIVTSLSKMMSKLPSASRYGLQLFWLAISLVRLVPPALFNCSAQFLEAVLTNISTVDGMRGESMARLLIQGRGQLEEAALPLDEVYGIHFTHDNFHFAVCACLTRGLVDTTTRPSAMRVLSAFLEMVNSPGNDAGRPSPRIVPSPYMSLIQARAANDEELRDALWLAGINPATIGPGLSFRKVQDLDLEHTKDRDHLLNTALELVDFQYLEDALQVRTLQWLTALATARPTVVVPLCGPIASILEDTLLHCQNASSLQAAHVLLQCLTSDASLSPALESPGMLDDILDEMGFGGLWRSCSFESSQQQDRECFALTEKLIEELTAILLRLITYYLARKCQK
ncbi:hypothetical protein ACRALDRAFT_1074229 [Sodiomyces alcalophilus JCM 7366]|uniref:uncharacterized protein n=1 Tax=Sodiomyces alcalophilus JCM 7366 TaxID=591952 RepID=UPI0039B596CE